MALLYFIYLTERYIEVIYVWSVNSLGIIIQYNHVSFYKTYQGFQVIVLFLY